MYCMRLARAHSGRGKILKFEGAYHGANEAGVTCLFPTKLLEFPDPELTSAGTPLAKQSLLVAPYNDLATTAAILEAHAGDLAGVIIEPLQRCTPPKDGFLSGVRELCDRLGIILIFDELVTGFRLAYGGAQEYYGVTPDLIAYGKALGGGYPIGVFGGRADIMDMVREEHIGDEKYVWMASTLGGNPISMAAARAAQSVFRQAGCYEHLHHLGDYLRDGLRRTLKDHQQVGQVIGDGPLAQVIFSDEPVFDYRSTARGNSSKGRALMLELFERRVFLNPMGTKLYLSLAHDEAACDEFLDRFDSSLRHIRRKP